MRKGHSRKHYFMVTSFCISIYNTYLIVKIRLKIDLEINWLMETLLHGHKGGDLSGLGTPEEKTYLEKYGFSCLGAPDGQKRDPFCIPFIDKYGTPATYTKLNSRRSWLIDTVYHLLVKNN